MIMDRVDAHGSVTGNTRTRHPESSSVEEQPQLSNLDSGDNPERRALTPDDADRD